MAGRCSQGCPVAPLRNSCCCREATGGRKDKAFKPQAPGNIPCPHCEDRTPQSSAISVSTNDDTLTPPQDVDGWSSSLQWTNNNWTRLTVTLTNFIQYVPQSLCSLLDLPCIPSARSHTSVSGDLQVLPSISDTLQSPRIHWVKKNVGKNKKQT